MTGIEKNIGTLTTEMDKVFAEMERLKKENSWQTNRSLGVNDNKSNEEAAQIPTESTGVLNQREGTEDTEEEFKVGVSNFN